MVPQAMATVARRRARGLLRPAAAAVLAVAAAAALALGPFRATGREPGTSAVALLRRAAYARWVALQRSASLALLAPGFGRLRSGPVTVWTAGDGRGAREEARVVARLAARYLPAVARDLGVSLPAAHVVIVPSAEELGRTVGLPSGMTALGVYWRGVIWVVAPSAWLDTVPGSGWEERFEVEGPVVHELAHQALDLLTAGNLPSWWDEGVAQYVEFRRTGFEWVEGTGRTDRDGSPLGRLMREFGRLEDEAAAYREAFLFVRHFAETYGEAGLARVNGLLAAGRPLPAALEEVAGKSLEGLERAWRGRLDRGFPAQPASRGGFERRREK